MQKTYMQMKIICFTNNGYELAKRVKALLSAEDISILYKGKTEPEEGVSRCETSLGKICETAFAEKTPLLFIGAMGIAIRHIAPFIKDKLSDPPVLVMDEKGLHIIPVLSGHVGGANEMAYKIAEQIGADPVLTTATDLNRTFSVDLFAKERGLEIMNRDGIAKVSVKALEGKPVTLSIKDYPPKEPVDVVITDEKERFSDGKVALRPKQYVLGIGCKKGKGAEAISALVEETLQQAGVGIGQIAAIGTIDLKAEEEGLVAFSRKHSLPLLAFDAALMEKAEGDFSPSAFVKQTTGVDNVCERAAVLAAGSGGSLVVRKQAKDGVTVAVARRSFRF